MSDTTTNASTSSEPAHRYLAFISYRHIEPDRRWARWLHTTLETYTLPSRLAAERGLPRKLGRVFRDEEELSASSDLSAEIDAALQQSQFLIVVCSPSTPASRWVDEEVRRFVALGRGKNVLTLLVEGEPESAFPLPLRESQLRLGLDDTSSPLEPLAADVREGAGYRAGHARGTAKIRLIAALLNLRYDDLRQREQLRRRRSNLLRGAAACVALLMVTVVLLAMHRSKTIRRNADLQAQLQQLIQDGDWSDARLAQMETVAGQLDQNGSTHVDSPQRQIYGRYADHLMSLIHQLRLEDGDVARIRAGIATLGAHDPQSSATADLQKSLEARLGDWELVEDLRPPFKNAKKYLDAKEIRIVEQSGLLLVGQRVEDHKVVPLVKMHLPVTERMRVELEYSKPDKFSDFPVGISFGTDLPHYFDITNGAWDDKDYVAMATDETICLRRGSTTLLRLPPTLPAQTDEARSTLTFTRVAQRYTVQADGNGPMTYEDPFSPVNPTQATVGIVGSLLPVTRLRIWTQRTPVLISALEKGDAYFAAGSASDALNEYRSVIPTVQGLVLREATFKAALCLKTLGQKEEAAQSFQRLFMSDSDRWAALSGIHLLQVLEQQSNNEEIGVVIDNLASRFPPQSFKDMVPEQLKRELVHYLIHGGNGRSIASDLLDLDATGLENRRRGAQLTKLIASEHWYFANCNTALMRGYERMGRLSEAIQFGREVCGTAPLESGVRLDVTDMYQWLLHESGQLALESEDLQSRIKHDPLDPAESWSGQMVLELARVRAAQGSWAEAESLVDKYFRVYLRERQTTRYLGAFLLKGFIRLQQGDRPGAIAAWNAGVLKIGGHGAGDLSSHSLEKLGSGTSLLYAMALGGLTGQWGDPEGKFVLSKMALQAADGEGSSSTAVRGMDSMMPARVIYKGWQTPRGERVARRLALRECTLTESVAEPVALMIEEFFRGGTPPINDQEEEVYWDCSRKVLEIYGSRKVEPEHMLAFAATWKGVTGFLGWGALHARLADMPEYHGPCAYILGRRYLTLKRPADAKMFFETALRDLPAESPISRLARIELARLTSATTRISSGTVDSR